MQPSEKTSAELIIDRLRGEGRDPKKLIELARREGLDQRLDATMIADIAVPEGALPEGHPDHLTDRDAWSVAWDEADKLLHAEPPNH
jgi:hypothetical protein